MLLLLLLFADPQWRIAAEKPAVVSFTRGVIDIDASAGLTLWYRPKLKGPVSISYDAMAISAGGANDRVSDLNCFWMAQNPLPARDGSFAAYNSLRAYYVGLGGNSNTTTRFRRYIGGAEQPPLLLSAPGHLLLPNIWQTIRVTANHHVIEFYRNGERLFHFEDPKPYEEGWFALRTTQNHMKIKNFRVQPH